MPDPTVAVLAAGTVFHGRYRIVRCINAGSMGAVYEVLDSTTESRRALKVMLPSTVEDPDLRTRFEREAKVTGRIESDHMVRVSDAGVDASTGTPFLVMDLLQGEELGSLAAKRSEPLRPAEVVLYLSQAALALDKTHAAGVVHRDLKPENIFVTQRDDGSPCVKILDFGIAKVVVDSSQAARATLPIGTPLYMAPEQIRGDAEVGPAADVHAIGHIAYTLLTSEPCWAEEASSTTLCSLLTKIMTGMSEPASERALRRRGVVLPPEFDAWLRTAVALRPGDRFGSASAAVGALGTALGVDAPRLSLIATELAARHERAGPLQNANRAPDPLLKLERDSAGAGGQGMAGTASSMSRDPVLAARVHPVLPIVIVGLGVIGIIVGAVIAVRSSSLSADNTIKDEPSSGIAAAIVPSSEPMASSARPEQAPPANLAITSDPLVTPSSGSAPPPISSPSASVPAPEAKSSPDALPSSAPTSSSVIQPGPRPTSPRPAKPKQPPKKFEDML